jgi:DNA-binding SARP family transcriptional activator
MNNKQIMGERRSTPQAMIRLLGGFAIEVHGRRRRLPPASQRVLAVLAVNGGDRDRDSIAELLWPEGRRSAASASLRSALWRTRERMDSALVDTDGDRLRLSSVVDVDLHQWQRRALDLKSLRDGELAGEMFGDALRAFSQPLLPAWGDEWLLFERERWDQLRVHALEQLAQQLVAADQHMFALQAALTAIGVEPIRESAHRTLICIHLAEGNRVSALHQYRRYQRDLARELGVRPSTQFEALLPRIVGE